jgi:hypothetical protein
MDAEKPYTAMAINQQGNIIIQNEKKLLEYGSASWIKHFQVFQFRWHVSEDLHNVLILDFVSPCQAKTVLNTLFTGLGNIPCTTSTFLHTVCEFS